jgi:hypothetical protein
MGANPCIHSRRPVRNMGAASKNHERMSRGHSTQPRCLSIRFSFGKSENSQTGKPHNTDPNWTQPSLKHDTVCTKIHVRTCRSQSELNKFKTPRSSSRPESHGEAPSAGKPPRMRPHPRPLRGKEPRAASKTKFPYGVGRVCVKSPSKF